MIRHLVAVLVLLVPFGSPGRADLVVLRGGSRLAFPACDEEAARVVCRTDAGTVAFPRSSVLQVLRGADEKAASPTWRADAGAADAWEGAAPRAGASPLELGLEGFRLEQAGDLEGAEAAYRAAAATRPPPTAARLGLARVLLRQGRGGEAIGEIERLLADRPGEPQAHAILGDALDAEDRLEDAVEAWRRAAELDPSFAGRLAEGRRELDAQRGYDRALAPHFSVTFDGERDEDLGGAIIEELEDAFDEFVTRFEHYPPRSVAVILYAQRDFEDLTGAGPEVAGLFDGKVRLPVGGLRRVTPEVRRVLRHELAHAFLHDKGLGRVPRWLHEGLAQRVESAEAPDTRRALRRSVEAAGDPAAWNAEFSYPKALSLVVFLEERHGEGSPLDLVAALGEGDDEESAIHRVFGVAAGRLREEWVAWLGEDPR